MIGKPSDDDIIAIREILTLLLLDIPYNNYKDGKRPQTLWEIIATDTDYTTVHGSKFLPLPAIKSYNPSITKDTVDAECLQKTTKWTSKKADRS